MLLLPVAQVLLIMMKRTNSTFLLKLLKYIMIALVAVVIVFTVIYEQLSIVISDGTFLERFRFGTLLFKNYGIHLFGSNIAYVSTVDARSVGLSNLVLDSAYLRLLIGYGIMVTIFIIGIFTKSISKAIKTKN